MRLEGGGDAETPATQGRRVAALPLAFPQREGGPLHPSVHPSVRWSGCPCGPGAFLPLRGWRN